VTRRKKFCSYAVLQSCSREVSRVSHFQIFKFSNFQIVFPMKNKSVLTTAIFAFAAFSLMAQSAPVKNPADQIIPVIHCSDFILTGDGNEPAWTPAQWIKLNSKQSRSYETQFRIMYSKSGIYCLYKCFDSSIVSTLKGDFLDLYKEDVVEAFFWTDESIPVYFEYELSPMNYELPIMVPNKDGNFYGWRPWRYEGERLTRHAVNITENAAGEGKSWTAEFFIPYALLSPIVSRPPGKGSRWRANFYRIDYDHGKQEWCWQPVPGTFHNYKLFGTLEFH
jgi:hypothetical protein